MAGPAFDPDFSVVGARLHFLFNESYYRAQNPSGLTAGMDALAHYRDIGWRNGLDPSALFPTDAYLAANLDVAGSGMSPLDHYIQHGMAEFRSFGLPLGPLGYRWDIAANVPQSQVDLIAEGLRLAENYIGTVLGSEIPASAKSAIIIKVENTGLGNQEDGAGGSVATGLSVQNDLLPRPYFDVGHPQWRQDLEGWGLTVEENIKKTVIHEFTHGWQSWLGAMSVYEQPLGNWINEGIAEYVAYAAAVDAGMITWSQVNVFMAHAASESNEVSAPLELYAGSQAPAWSGHVGYLAIDWLISTSPHGERAILLLAERTAAARGTGDSVSEVFESVFGLTLESFYQQFEVWRPAIADDPAIALSVRPELVLDDLTVDLMLDNVFAMPGQHTTIDGQGGVDSLVIDGLKEDYSIGQSGQIWIVSEAGGEPLVSLVNVERIVFEDGVLALDLNGNAGMAYRIYQAAFARTPDNDGLEYWIEALDAGQGLYAVGLGFVHSAEFSNLYGNTSDVGDFVNRVYNNILGRDGEPEGLIYWTSEIEAGRRDMASVLIGFSESQENKALVLPAIEDGIWYA
jgi:hypothetical protein